MDQSDGVTKFVGPIEAKFRKTRYGVYPYFEIPFTGRSVVSVVLGPKNRTPIEVVASWLKARGHSKVGVAKSDATYR